MGAARELQGWLRMWNDDDELTPLGDAYRDCKNAIAELRRRWSFEHSRVELDRHVRATESWMDLAMGPLDDLYGGDEAMLEPHAAFEHATEAQRWAAHDAYKRVLALQQYLIFDCPASRERDFASLMAELLLDQLSPFVSRADDAMRRVALREETVEQSLARVNPEISARYRSA